MGRTETRAEGPGFGVILVRFRGRLCGAVGPAGRGIWDESDAQIVLYWSQNPRGAAYL